MSGKQTVLAEELERLEKIDPELAQQFIDDMDFRNMDPKIRSLILTSEDLRTMKYRPKNGVGSFQRSRGEKIWWVDTSGWDGMFLFSFDRKKVYDMFRDYPHELTNEEKELFDKENPFWADFFRTRPRRKPAEN